MRKFKTEILIRNNRLEKMQQAGIKVNYSILNDEDYINELKAKIIEEANEAAQAQNKQAKLGGFEKRIKTHYLEIAEDNKDELSYYLAHLDKYPEITD